MPPKTDKDAWLGLAPAEGKIILRALLFAEDIKPDYKLLADKHGVTLNSARSMFPKAMKRWRELNASPTETVPETDATTAGEEEAPQEAPKPKKSCGSGQKRKRGGDQPLLEADRDDNSAPAVSSEVLESNATSANVDPAPKPKKSRGSGQKRKRGGDQPLLEADQADNSAPAVFAEAPEGNTTSANDDQAPKPKKSRGKGRKAKHVEDAPAPVVEKPVFEEPVYQPESEPGPAIEMAEFEIEVEPEIQGEPAIQGEPERASIHCEEQLNVEYMAQHHTASGYDADDDLA